MNIEYIGVYEYSWWYFHGKMNEQRLYRYIFKIHTHTNLYVQHVHDLMTISCDFSNDNFKMLPVFYSFFPLDSKKVKANDTKHVLRWAIALWLSYRTDKEACKKFKGHGHGHAACCSCDGTEVGCEYVNSIEVRGHRSIVGMRLRKYCHHILIYSFFLVLNGFY